MTEKKTPSPGMAGMVPARKSSCGWCKQVLAGV